MQLLGFALTFCSIPATEMVPIKQQKSSLVVSISGSLSCETEDCVHNQLMSFAVDFILFHFVPKFTASSCKLDSFWCIVMLRIQLIGHTWWQVWKIDKNHNHGEFPVQFQLRFRTFFCSCNWLVLCKAPAKQSAKSNATTQEKCV